MFNNILMPTDGSEHSERAIERGIELARLCGAKVTGIHVLPDYVQALAFAEYAYADQVTLDKVERDEYVRAAHFLDFVQKTAAMARVPCETVVATSDHPYDAIVDAANEHHCDLIIMTARNRRGLAALLMGSEAERVLHRTSIPILMFRALMSVDHPDKTLPREQDRLHGHSGANDVKYHDSATAYTERFQWLHQRDTAKRLERLENYLCS